MEDARMCQAAMGLKLRWGIEYRLIRPLMMPK